MSSVKIKYKLKVKEGTKSALKKYVDKVYSRLDKDFKETFGSGRWSDYSNRKNSGSPAPVTFDGMPSTKYTSQLLDIYSEVMGYRYEKLAYALDSIYSESTRQRKSEEKRQMIEEGVVTDYGFPVISTEAGFLTGNFYNTTIEDIRKNGGRAISMSNLFLYSQIQVYAEDFGLSLANDGSSYGTPYVLEFLQLLADRQILPATSSEQGLWDAYFRLPKGDVNAMGKVYLKAAREFRKLAKKTLRETKM